MLRRLGFISHLTFLLCAHCLLGDLIHLCYFKCCPWAPDSWISASTRSSYSHALSLLYFDFNRHLWFRFIPSKAQISPNLILPPSFLSRLFKFFQTKSYGSDLVFLFTLSPHIQLFIQSGLPVPLKWFLNTTISCLLPAPPKSKPPPSLARATAVDAGMLLLSFLSWGACSYHPSYAKPWLRLMSELLTQARKFLCEGPLPASLTLWTNGFIYREIWRIRTQHSWHLGGSAFYMVMSYLGSF